VVGWVCIEWKVGSGSGFGEIVCGVREVVRVSEGENESIGIVRKSIGCGFNLGNSEQIEAYVRKVVY
jgi:hypothetical protein